MIEKFRRYIRIKSRLYQLRFPSAKPAVFALSDDDNVGIVIRGR